MNLAQIEETYKNLSDTSLKRGTIATKKYQVGNHTFFMCSEKGVPILLVSSSGKEVSSITKLGLDSLNILVRNLKLDNEKESEYLVVSLRKSEHSSIYFRVIESIVNDFERKSGDTFTLCTLNLKRWKSFWDTKVHKGMSEAEMLGLYGELSFIKNIYESTGKLVVDRWTGPLGSEHDFIFSENDYEIKTTKTTVGMVTISSLRQLEISDGKKLFLVIFEVFEGQNSLKDLVYFIDSKADSEEQEIFWRKLARLGYRLDEEHTYDDFRYEVKTQKIYEVRGSFPRITNGSFKTPLDARIRNLIYSVEIKDLDDFLISEKDHFKNIKL